MAASTGDNKKIITDINITPMVDVVLVLLIIFMATAPLIHRRALNVNVPKAAHTEPKATATFQIQFTVEGEIYVDGETYSFEDLEQELQKRFFLEPALHVSISADKAIPYGRVVELLDLVRGTGVKKVALEVKPRTKS